MHWKTILCPTDYTAFSERALRLAVELTRECRAHLIVLHAVETLGPENVSYGEATSGMQPEAYRQRLWQELQQHGPAPDAQIDVKFVLSEEEPAAAIADAATLFACDLIVMGTHGRSGLRRWLEGSVAEQVIRLANCPVLVVKEPRTSGPASSETGTALHPHFLTHP
jgi:nucleotide-binding universal stress UspA family protein